jgi:hypothetical protein
LQHTPSAQKPELQALAPLHVAPLACLARQTEFAQNSPAAHWASALQLVRQAFAPHTYGAQAVTVGAGQLPVPVQVAAAVWLPLPQEAVRQVVLAPG